MAIKGDQSHDIAEPISTLQVVEVNSRTDPRWEAFVNTHPNSLIYHHPAWLQVLEEAYAYKPVNLACEDPNGQFRGILPRTRSEPGAQFQLKMMSNALDGLVDGVVSVPWRETYVLELPERPELIRIGNSRNHARIKWAVNKATRLGVEIHAAETEHELRA